MDYVFVLEDDPVYQKQIVEALKQIQESFEIRTFDSLDAFSHLVKSVMTHGPLALAKDDRESGRVVLVVARLEFIGADRLSLLEKTRDFFLRRGICTAEEPLRFVLTAFDEPGFKLDELKQNIVTNVIFKPFDRLILQQHLQLAMPQVKAGADALSMQKASALVEMLKTVHLETMTELGFVSLSNRAFEPGVVNKYYGRDFVSDRHRSVMARLVDCRPVGENYWLDFRFFALDPTQISHIRKRVRAKDAHGPHELKPPRLEGVAGNGKAFIDSVPARMNFVIVSADEDEARSLAGTLQRKLAGSEAVRFGSRAEFEGDLAYADGAAARILPQGKTVIEVDRGMKVTSCAPADATLWGEPLAGAGLGRFLTKEEGQNLGLWLMGKKSELSVLTQANEKYGALKFERDAQGAVTVRELADLERADFLRGFRRLKHPVAAVILDHQALDLEHPAAFENFLANLEKDQGGRRPPVFLLANREFTDDEERRLATFVDDVFFQPLDRIYLLQKILFSVPGLKVLEDPVPVNEKPLPQVIRAANPVQVEEISEAVLVMSYYRPVEIHSFREFLLWQPYEIAAPELCGVVHQVDPGADAKSPLKIRFTFFGMRDEQLKAIRLWILNHYIQGKEDKG